MKRTRTNKKADLILTSDWHLRETIPECRTDDFWTTQWKKVAFVSQLQNEHDCPVIHAGDLFHHWKPSPHLLSITMSTLPSKFCTIYGQHDLPQHNFEERDKSGIHTLEQARRLTVLKATHWNQKPAISYRVDYMVNDPDYSVLQRNILVWHKLVYQTKPFPGATGGRAGGVLRKYPEYDCILTGDNHQAFTETYQGRVLCNPGSLMRQSADQIDFRPRVYLYYAATNDLCPVYVPIESGVVSRSHIEGKQKRDQRIEAFVTKLNSDWQAEMSFEENLNRFFLANKTKSEIKNIIYKSIEI